MSELSHLDQHGAARMVDVSGKADTVREAVATGRISMSAAAIAAVRDGTTKKGDVLAVARVAGILAAKKTSDLIPLCHPIALNTVTIHFTLGEDAITVAARCRSTGPTGVEMEALTAVSVALLTLYDMTKSMGFGMTITDIRLIAKVGGKSGDWHA